MLKIWRAEWRESGMLGKKQEKQKPSFPNTDKWF